jgi:hypothetical protein
MYKIISAKRLSNGAGGNQIYTKSGTIRKDCKVQEFDGTPEKMRDYLKRINWTATGKPYIFTHIVGQDLFGNKSIVKQEVSGLICSPTELAELLGI